MLVGAKFIEEHCKKISEYGAEYAFLATPLLKEKGRVIEWSELKDLLQNQDFRKEIGILDLRQNDPTTWGRFACCSRPIFTEIIHRWGTLQRKSPRGIGVPLARFRQVVIRYGRGRICCL